MTGFPASETLPSGVRLVRGQVVRDVDALRGVRRLPEVEAARAGIRREHHDRLMDQLDDLLSQPGCVRSRHSGALRTNRERISPLALPRRRTSFRNLVILRDGLTYENLTELLDNPNRKTTEASLRAFREGTPKLGLLLDVIDKVLAARARQGGTTNPDSELVGYIRHPEEWCRMSVANAIIAARDNGKLIALFLETQINREDIGLLRAHGFLDDAFLDKLDEAIARWLDTSTRLYQVGELLELLK